ncbi:alpha/beta fold hydrolase [Paracoccus sp. MKU1]|uniref:alpha/beta fold hydrolase n=1 Tax=Paracoccus sp. MKU1 TaxID=1745182 RepID=UPI00071920EC|nr:alpha/beta hydrolase [Paracoccus sp. MKU1]KRW94668.1 hydrolase [Paracoccus sp. MKU1]
MNGPDAAPPRNCRWDVDELQLGGLSWGHEGGTPVLALHGWMDHAASFQELAPRLIGCHVVALDLSGQGQSGHRSPHATYNIWDDLPQIAGVLDQLGWRDCVLLGHSRGASIATLFAAAQPERARALVALDWLVPEPMPDESVVSTLRAFIEETRRQKASAPRTFASKADYIERRRAQGNSRQTSEALAERALIERPGGFQLRGDPRHFASSAVKLTQGQVEAVLRAIRCPVLNLWAEDGVKSRRPKAMELARLGARLIPDYDMAELPGDHHFHLDPRIAERIASAILAFLARNGRS